MKLYLLNCVPLKSSSNFYLLRGNYRLEICFSILPCVFIFKPYILLLFIFESLCNWRYVVCLLLQLVSSLCHIWGLCVIIYLPILLLMVLVFFSIFCYYKQCYSEHSYTYLLLAKAEISLDHSCWAVGYAHFSVLQNSCTDLTSHQQYLKSSHNSTSLNFIEFGGWNCLTAILPFIFLISNKTELSQKVFYWNIIDL